MKLGKDNVGPLYFTGLILVLLTFFLAAYGAITNFWLLILGIAFLPAGFIICRIDIRDHRKIEVEETV